MNNLKQLREEQHLSLTEISTLLNTNKQTYFQWENEINQMNYSTLYKLADFFNVSIDYLLCRSDKADNIQITNELELNDRIILTHFHQADNGTQTAVKKLLDIN